MQGLARLILEGRAV